MRFLVVLYTFISSGLYAQLHCETAIKDNGTTKSCYHANKKLSTIEFWDKEKKFGDIKGYDNNGKELFSYSLSRVFGHASVSVKYHSNGQVAKVEFTSHPDGGIQSYHYISEFNEHGVLTNYIDLSRPDGFFRLNINPVPYPKETVRCAVPFVTSCVIINETKYKARVHFYTEPNNQGGVRKDTVFVVLPKQKIVADSVIQAEFFLKPDVYKIEFTDKQLKGRRFKLIASKAIEEKTRRTYTFHILEQE